jgi:trans-2,3-dihydro-3-hydroxyanthranilate isomerase
MERSFVTVDVFTDCRFGGNPLAVVLDAQGLGTEEARSCCRRTTRVIPPR